MFTKKGISILKENKLSWECHTHKNKLRSPIKNVFFHPCTISLHHCDSTNQYLCKTNTVELIQDRVEVGVELGL